MKLIVAVNNWGYIGRDGELMWKCKPDMLHFKQLTKGGEIIVGKTTYEKCLGGKNLPGRNMYIVGTDHRSLYQAVRRAIIKSSLNQESIWVIGGSQIYKHLVHLCEEIHISHINNNEKGDTSFEIPPDYRGKVFHYYFEEDGRSIDNVKEA